jgi:hypothetical protein
VIVPGTDRTQEQAAILRKGWFTAPEREAFNEALDGLLERVRSLEAALREARQYVPDAIGQWSNAMGESGPVSNRVAKRIDAVLDGRR